MLKALLVTLCFSSMSFAATLKCGLGAEESKLEYVRTAELKRGQKEVTLRFEDKNRLGIKYYQAKVYLDYKAEGDEDKDVVELILASNTGITAISSQKVATVEGDEVFTLYLVASPTKFVQLLCLVQDDDAVIK
jgi:hypothetical protein